MKLLAALLIVVSVCAGSLALFFAGAVFLVIASGARLWMNRISTGLLVRRSLSDTRLFFGEAATVTLRVENKSALPVPWLQVRDEVPPSLTARGRNTQVVSLGPRSSQEISYTLTGLRRGLHTIGPLWMSVGDVFSLAQQELQAQASLQIMVYPRLLPAGELDLPSQSPFGSLRSRRLLQGDPSRMVGVRDYHQGDAFHDIHWGATASAGALQVKQYQPTIAIQAVIFLDLQVGSYASAYSAALPELAVSVAATLAYRLIRERQEVGLATNGRLHLDQPARTVASGHDGPAMPYEYMPVRTECSPPAKGQPHLLHLLEMLARTETQRLTTPLVEMLTKHSLGLPWGTTVVVITGHIDDALFLTLHRLREAGLLVVLYAIGRQPEHERLEARARSLGIHLRIIYQS